MLMTFVLKNILNNEMGGAKICHREINFQNAVFLYSPCFSLYESSKWFILQNNKISQTAGGNNIFSIDAIKSL